MRWYLTVTLQVDALIIEVNYTVLARYMICVQGL